MAIQAFFRKEYLVLFVGIMDTGAVAGIEQMGRQSCEMERIAGEVNVVVMLLLGVDVRPSVGQRWWLGNYRGLRVQNLVQATITC